MNKYISKDTTLFLDSLIIPYNIRFIILNFNEIIFDTRKKNEKINKNFLCYLKNITTQKNITEKKYLNIFEDENSSKFISSLLILPIKNSESNICCFIVAINNNTFFDKISTEFFYSIKTFLESKYGYIKRNENFGIFPKFNYYKNIKKQLYLNDSYMNINSLLIYNLNLLYENLDNENLAILNKIIDLEEQKNELTTIYSIEISSINNINN